MNENEQATSKTLHFEDSAYPEIEICATLDSSGVNVQCSFKDEEELKKLYSRARQARSLQKRLALLGLALAVEQDKL